MLTATNHGRSGQIPGVGHLALAAGDTRVQDEIERFLIDVWQTGGWEDAEPDRMLATVLFTDIVGSAAKAIELGDRHWRELLERHNTHGKVAGIAVHTGARVAARADANEVLVSNTVKDLVAGSGIAFMD